MFRLLSIFLLLLCSCATLKEGAQPRVSDPTPPAKEVSATETLKQQAFRMRNGLKAFCGTRRSFADFAENRRDQRDQLMTISYRLHRRLDYMVAVLREHIASGEVALPEALMLAKSHNELARAGRELADAGETLAIVLHDSAYELAERPLWPTREERLGLQQICRARADHLMDYALAVRATDERLVAFMVEQRTRGVPYSTFTRTP